MWRTAVPPNGRLIAETQALPSNDELAKEIADRYTQFSGISIGFRFGEDARESGNWTEKRYHR